MTGAQSPKRKEQIIMLEDFFRGVKEKSNGQYVALCPWHEDHHPSLSIRADPDGEGFVYYCFACGRSGNQESLKDENQTFRFLDHKNKKERFWKKRIENKNKKRFIYGHNENTKEIIGLPEDEEEKAIFYREELVTRKTKIIYFVEGEKKCDAMNFFLNGDHVALSFANFSKVVFEEKDLSFLYLKNVKIICDNDDVGREKAKSFQKYLLEKFVPASISDPFIFKKKSYDIQDYINEFKNIDINLTNDMTYLEEAEKDIGQLLLVQYGVPGKNGDKKLKFTTDLFTAVQKIFAFKVVEDLKNGIEYYIFGRKSTHGECYNTIFGFFVDTDTLGRSTDFKRSHILDHKRAKTNRFFDSLGLSRVDADAGKKVFDDLYELFPGNEDRDKLKNIFLKYLIGSIHSISPIREGMPPFRLVLCLVSEQEHIGKTMFFKSLFGDERTSIISNFGDFGQRFNFSRRLVRSWCIVIDDASSMQTHKNFEMVKSIISQDVDLIDVKNQQPYEQRRSSVFGLTSNDTTFLRRGEKNTRFLVFQLNKFGHWDQWSGWRSVMHLLSEERRRALWSYARHLYEYDPSSYILDPDELIFLTHHNRAHSSAVTAEDILLTHLEPGENYRTLSQVLSELRLRSGLNPNISAKMLARILRDNRFPERLHTSRRIPAFGVSWLEP